jgi:hypothetical protein
MGSRGVVLAVAFSSMATAAVGQALPTAEPILARSNDVMAEAFAPVPLWGRSSLNWSDLPFTISATETTGYNDNILGLAQGQPLSPGTPSRGDFFSNTVFGASTKMYLGQQQFFADGTYGLTRYLTDSADNTHQYSLDAGLNWQIASFCSGRFIAAQNDYQSPITQQVGPGINTVLANSVSETTTCLLTGNLAVILDSGWSSSQNSGGVNVANNNSSVYVRGGLQYSLTGLDTARALITDTKTQFSNRGTGLAAAGLAAGTDQIDYQLFYNRVLSPKLTFDGMIGISQATVMSATPGTGSPTQSTPIYSVALNWQPTPKLSFGIASSKLAGAPTNILSNFELETAQSVTATYGFSPKTSLQLGISQTMSSGGITSNGALPSIASNNPVLASFCTVRYLISPFLTTTASYQYTESANGGLETKDNIYMLSLVYAPY